MASLTVMQRLFRSWNLHWLQVSSFPNRCAILFVAMVLLCSLSSAKQGVHVCPTPDQNYTDFHKSLLELKNHVEGRPDLKVRGVVASCFYWNSLLCISCMILKIKPVGNCLTDKNYTCREGEHFKSLIYPSMGIFCSIALGWNSLLSWWPMSNKTLGCLIVACFCVLTRTIDALVSRCCSCLWTTRYM